MQALPPLLRSHAKAGHAAGPSLHGQAENVPWMTSLASQHCGCVRA